MILKKIKNKMFIDHIVLTVSNLDETHIFYSKIFGEADFIDNESVMFCVSKTRLFFVEQKTNSNLTNRFNPNQIGLEHLAFGIDTLEELNAIDKMLTKERILHSGVHIDRHSEKEKIWLNDPSGIRIEFFIR